MEIRYFNGKYIPSGEVKINPDDRGFLFADGVYEVVKWYGGFFFDFESHLARLKRSLREIHINWDEADTFREFATELIMINGLSDSQAVVYLQVTRGSAPRTHSFPDPAVPPTIYAFAREIKPAGASLTPGIKVMLKEDIRWARCDIKSVSLLANTLSFQEAHEKGFKECIFVRNSVITEGSHSNIFFVANGKLITHPESQFILSGISRKNVLVIAKKAGIPIAEEALPEKDLRKIEEAFITNTTGEVTPVTAINEMTVGSGSTGPVTDFIRKNFIAATTKIRG